VRGLSGNRQFYLDNVGLMRKRGRFTTKIRKLK
jgi:hypothetical protein